MQAVRRRRGARPGAITGFNDLWYVFRLKPALTDFKKRSRYGSNHILQKSISANSKDPFGIGPFPGRVIDRSCVVLNFSRRRAKRSEIVAPEKMFRCLIDCFFVERIPERVHITALEGADDGRAPDVILIGLRTGRPPRVKLEVDFFHADDPDFGGEQRIDSPQNGVGIHRAFRLNIRHLPVRMNTGIGAARSRHFDFMIEQLLQRALKFTLHGAVFRLNLPAVKLGAVVGKCELEVPHPIGYSMWLGVRAMPRVTGTIITFNEEHRIAEAIATLACCEEVIVVDSGSTDRTREIATVSGARVIERKWSGYSNQKNFAADQAENDWILSIDADERLSIELADEITAWKKIPAPSGEAGRSAVKDARLPSAYSMPRRVFYLGRWIGHSGWYPDRKIRLYNRTRCRWAGDLHESVKVNGDTGRFRGDLLHFSFRDWPDHSQRVNKYTELAATAARASGRRGSVFALLFAPPVAFIKSFFFRAGFLDGWRGLIIAYMGARYVFQREFRILR